MNHKVWIVDKGQRLCVTVWGHRPWGHRPVEDGIGCAMAAELGDFLIYAGCWRWVQVRECEPVLSAADTADLRDRL